MSHQWLCGPAHCGKSAKAFAGYSSTHTFVYDGNWNGLMPSHTHIIIDDLTPDLMDHRTLARVADRHPFFVMVNGRRTLMNNPVRVTVTSLYDPESCYEGTENYCEEVADKLTRRFEVQRLGDARSPEIESSQDEMDSDPEWLGSDED